MGYDGEGHFALNADATTNSPSIHGLKAAPSKLSVVFQETGGVLTSAWADGTNVNITANAKQYKWSAEV